MMLDQLHCATAATITPPAAIDIIRATFGHVEPDVSMS